MDAKIRQILQHTEAFQTCVIIRMWLTVEFSAKHIHNCGKSNRNLKEPSQCVLKNLSVLCIRFLPTFKYIFFITIQHYRCDTMGCERQWLPHGQYKKTCNVNLTTTILQMIKANKIYTRFCSISDVRFGLWWFKWCHKRNLFVVMDEMPEICLWNRIHQEKENLRWGNLIVA